MTKTSLSLVLLALLSGCATTSHPPEYQVGYSAPKQDRASAEQVHAEKVAHLSLPGYDSPPQVITSRFPEYPQSWRNLGIQGTVVTQFTIEADGRVSNPSVVGAPPAELAAIVLHAIMQWRFRPAMKSGSPVAIQARQEFTFKAE